MANTARSLFGEPTVQTEAPVQTAPRPSRAPARKRGDIEGLRAVAVVLVILDHLLGWPAGGFVGVDVFFVISGFLITSLLLREAQASGRISLVGFYRRRIKRIVPVALLVLVGTALTAHLVFIAARADQVRVDTLYAAAFWANWHFGAVGTDYFQQGQSPSPAQHFWSLSVEEQFYVLWPWLLLVLVIAARRVWARRAGHLIFAGALTLTVASFAWSLHQSAAEPTVAYFSSFGRAWEIGVGACVALLPLALDRVTVLLRLILGWAGLIAIVASALAISATSAFPAPWAAVPVAGAALVIVAGTGAKHHRYIPALTNPVAGYLGTLSYSLYLWHWPVIVFAQALTPHRGAIFYVATASTAVALSAASYHLVENPIRTSELLVPRADRKRRGRPARRIERRARLAVTFVSTAVLLSCAILSVATMQGRSVHPIVAFDASGQDTGSTPSGHSSQPGDTRPEPAVRTAQPGSLPPVTVADLTQALATQRWPDIDLSQGGLHSLQSKFLTPDCLANYAGNDKGVCHYLVANPTERVALLGDSIALAWGPALQSAFPTWDLTTYAKEACPWANAILSNSATSRYTSCLDFHQAAFQQLRELAPDVIFLSSAEHQIGNLAGPARAHPDRLWPGYERQTLVQLEKLTRAKIVILTPPPRIASLTDCATQLNTPRDCAATISDAWHRTFVATQKAAAGDRRVTLIDDHTWFCADLMCPPIFQGVPIRSDDVHVTQLYAQRIAPNLAAALRAIPGVVKR